MNPSDKPPATIDRLPALVRSLSLTDATMLVVGCIVGVGIFRTASSIAGYIYSPALTLALWVVGGLVSLCGALCYAELAAMFPSTGGDYVFIREIYGRFWAFLFGWTKLFIERTGTIAILGFVFAEYASRILPLPAVTLRWMAAAAVLLLTTVNVAGIRWGTTVQNILTVLKIAALGMLIAVGLLAPPAAAGPATSAASASGLQAWGVAFVFVLWTYGGWTEAAYVAEEVKQPVRNIPRAIIGGVVLTAILYVLVNWSYLRFIPMDQLPHATLVASSVMERAMGPFGSRFITVMVACSAFGALNGYILTGARILYAIGRDHAIFARLGTIHPRLHTPALALWTNAAIAIVLVCTKRFDQIMTYSTVVISVFFTLTVFGLIVLRRRLPNHPRPYQAWGYPWTPVIFCLVMAGFIIDVCVKKPSDALFGFALLALAVPLYHWSSRTPHRSTALPLVLPQP